MILSLFRIKIILASTLLLLATSALSSEKNITYMQILQKPNDLDLNLKYAQQQGKMGNYKQTISTLERLTMIYPENIEIKLYLLSVLVQVDSPEKANTIIEEMKLRTDLSPEDLETLKEIEEEILDREPSLWNISADIGFGSSCGCFGSNSDTCTNAPFHSLTISLYGNSIPDLSDIAFAYLPVAYFAIMFLDSMLLVLCKC